jgi:uncharacterized protein
MINALQQTWPWWISGILIAGIMFTLIFFGRSFGFSSNLRNICAAAGCGKHVKFFDFNWRSQSWNLVFLLGAILGGTISANFLALPEPMAISQNTVEDLSKLGISAPVSLQPEEIYGIDALFSMKGFLILATGGLLVGFGSRYAGGCTSGHAISGLSNLQLPSLLAVLGFFAGGLIMTFFILPFIF